MYGSTVMFSFLVPFVLHAETRVITFPVIGVTHYSDDFGAPRAGHTHQGNDVIGHKGQPLIAAVNGTVQFVTWPEASYGYMVSLKDTAGYEYWYLHINNDTPGTDDGNGGGDFAYAPGIDNGYPVTAGQLIGWMGDSGDAENTVSHLHFEIHDPSGTAFDPYPSLQAANHIATPIIPSKLPGEILPYDQFSGGANIALAQTSTSNVNLITGAAAGGGPRVTVISPTGKILQSFYAYDKNFHGGVDVATGDIDGDGIPEIVTAPGAGAPPQIRIFDLTGKLLNHFLAYDKNFRGGVRVTISNINHDSTPEIIVVPANSGTAQVRIFTVQGKVLGTFLAFSKSLKGSWDVTAANRRIIVSAGVGKGPQVNVFNPHGQLLTTFFAYDPAFHGGVRLSADNDTILTVPANAGSADIRQFNLDGTLQASATAFERWYTGGFDVAQLNGTSFISSATPGRVTTVRSISFASQGGNYDHYHAL